MQRALAFSIAERNEPAPSSLVSSTTNVRATIVGGTNELARGIVTFATNVPPSSTSGAIAVIVKPWEFQQDKADVVWRYTKTQAEYLSRREMIPKQIDVFQ